MTRRIGIENEMIALEAPGSFFSGLLGVPAAGRIFLNAGVLHTLPVRPASWLLLGAASGRVQAAWEDEVWALESGQCAAFPPGASLGLLPLSECALGLMEVQGSAAEAILARCGEEGGYFFPQGGAALEQVLRLLEAQRHPPTAGEASERAYSLLLRLCGTGKPGPEVSRRLPWVVEAALGILRREYAFLDGIGELADRLEVSQEYLTRAFRDCIGMTPGRYLTQVRLEHAKLMLLQGEHSVAVIADACGFSNSNYFARVFRENTGMTPRAYAKSGAAAPARATQDDSLYLL